MQSCKKRTWLHFQTFSFLKKCWPQHSIDGAKTFSLSGLIKLLVQSHSLVCCPCISKIQQMYLYLHFNNGSSFFTWNREKLLIIYQSVCLPARISSPVQSMVDTPLSFCCTNQKLSDDIIALIFDGKDNEN